MSLDAIYAAVVMERIGMGGFSLEGAGIRGLSLLRVPPEAQLGDFLRELADSLFASEVVLLSTCNRVEVIYARELGEAPGSEDTERLAKLLGCNQAGAQKPGLMTGAQAVQHLFRVASSLDSAVQGEDQILGQVRMAYLRSKLLGLTGPVLDPLFEASLQLGKQVRTQTELSRHPISVTSVGVALLRGEATEESMPLVAAVIGAGATGRLAAQALQDAGFRVGLIVNRTLARAQSLAASLGARALSLDEFMGTPASELGSIDVLVSATGSRSLILNEERLGELASHASAGRGLLALDLALPRDLADCAPSTGVVLFDLEAVRVRARANQAKRAEAALEAELLVQQKCRGFARRAAQRQTGERIAEYQQDAKELLEREMQRLGTGALAALPEGMRDEVLRWAHSAFHRANHLSLSFCKRVLREVPQLEGIDEGETTG